MFAIVHTYFTYDKTTIFWVANESKRTHELNYGYFIMIEQ